MYRDLIEQFDSLRKSTLRFYRVALHAHSPQSHDWGRNSNDPQGDEKSRFDGPEGESLFIDDIAEHLDLVAITDHVRCGFASNISRKSINDDRIKILPGMEVNLRLPAPFGSEKIHVLAIFEIGTPTAKIERLFHNTNIAQDSERIGSEVIDLELKEWVSRVHSENGICIGAHVSSNKGVRKAFRRSAKGSLFFCDADSTTDFEAQHNIPEQFITFLLDAKIDAIEISKAEERDHYHSNSQSNEFRIPCLLTFDAHTLEEYNQRSKVTHIKMAQPNLKGIKQALQVPETRIRFPENLPPTPHPRILGIRVQGGEGALFNDLVAPIAENLTCIIGVRGSGKSTLVEALRYVFGYNRSLSDIEELESEIRGRQRENLADTLIEVAYRVNDFGRFGDLRGKAYCP